MKIFNKHSSVFPAVIFSCIDLEQKFHLWTDIR